MRTQQINKFLPKEGEGDTIASQIAVAVSKLGYKFENDGDTVHYDGNAEGGNDLSSYANWLYYNVPELEDELKGLGSYTVKAYAKEIVALVNKANDIIANYADKPAVESVYEGRYDRFDGPFYGFADDGWDDDDEF